MAYLWLNFSLVRETKLNLGLNEIKVSKKLEEIRTNKRFFHVVLIPFLQEKLDL